MRASFATGFVSEPQLATNGAGKVLVAYVDDGDGLRDVYFNYSPDSGAAFQPFDLRMDVGSPVGQDDAFTVRLAPGGLDAAYVVWVDTRTNAIQGDIYFNYASE